jgi:hypothetical protein
MAFIEIDDTDWANLQYILLNCSGTGITPAMAIRLLNKFGAQLQQRGNGNAIATGSPAGGDDQRALSPRIEAEVATADHRDSDGQRAQRQARRP